MKKILFPVFLLAFCLLAGASALAANEKTEAAIIVKSGTKLDEILKHNGAKKDVKAQENAMISYTGTLIGKLKGVKQNQKYAINNFIVYGTKETKQLVKQQRFEILLSYQKKYKKLPLSEADWINVLKMKPSAPAPTAGFSCGQQITDRDGQKYRTVKIGTQCWMADNLNTGKMISCSAALSDRCVALPADSKAIEKWCYNNKAENCSLYGGLYQWSEAMQLPETCVDSDCSAQIKEKHQGICLAGWHIPSDNEWLILYQYLAIDGQGGKGTDNGGKLREAGTAHWDKADCGSSTCNSAQFNALPAGQHSTDNLYRFLKEGTSWWTTNINTPPSIVHSAYYALASWDNSLHYSYTSSPTKTDGYSVRCVKD